MFKPTPIDQLRQPHPDQDRIDAESARLLRTTARPTSEAKTWERPNASPRPEKQPAP